jgi:hypothetical protein
LTVIHARLATTMVLFCLIAAGWGLVLYFRRRNIDGNFWGILATGELLILAQAALGLFLWARGAQPGRSIHILYGVVAVLTIPAVYGFTKGRDDRPMALTYALLLLFLVGISFRAMTTGG